MDETPEPLEPAKPPAEAQPEEHPRDAGQLSLWLRIVLLTVGWILVLIGIAGLVLPGIQGIATILVGAAVLSLASELAHEWLERLLGRWPGVWDRFQRFRNRLHEKLHRR